MKYLQGTFQVAMPSQMTNKRWDYTFKSKAEFMKLYDVTEEQYAELKNKWYD